MSSWVVVLVPVLMASVDTPPHRTDFSRFDDDRVEACLRDVRRTPDALLPYSRLQRLTLRPRDRAEALAALEKLAARSRTRFRAELALGLAWMRLGQRPVAERLLSSAAEGLRQAGEGTGETYARLHLEYLLRTGGRHAEAREQLQRAKLLAAASGDALLAAQVQIFEGWEALVARDHSEARRLFDSARMVLAGGPNGYLESMAWEGLASVDTALGRGRGALEHSIASVAALARERSPTAWARADLADKAYDLAWAGEVPWAEVDHLIAEAVTDAEQAGSSLPLMRARLLGALRLGATERGVAEFRRAVEAARAIGDSHWVIYGLWRLAEVQSRVQPDALDENQRLADEAITLAREAGLTAPLRHALSTRAQLRWAAGQVGPATEDSEAALRLFDLERDRQAGEAVRIGNEALRGRAYVEHMQPFFARGLLANTFHLSERMRARALLESLESPERKLSPELGERRESVRRRLVELQSELIDPRLDLARREHLKQQLRNAELEEERLLEDQDRTAGARHSAIIALEGLQHELRADEALLSFVVAPTGRPDQGDAVLGPRSFVLAVTRDQIRGVRIPDRDQLAPSLRMFEAMVQAGSPEESVAAARLYRDLLREAMAGLGPEVRRLILLPDGVLHPLPFEVLRPAPDAEPLGVRYTIVRAPSATLWVRTRARSGSEQREPLLALADPSSPSAEVASVRQAAPWLEGLRLGALPHARLEAEHAVRLLGGESRLLLGAAASERALKQESLRHWSALHLGAHAVVDEEVPARSAIVLAPGSSDEDGLVQIRDVAELDLDGLLVVLASCRSASGALFTGEGPVGLSRAFLRSGARAVVVSLWDIGDAATEKLLRGFYRRLAEGDSVQEALRVARQERRLAGAPSAEWAGLIVVGDGDLRLAPVRSRSWAIATAVLLGLGLTAAVLAVLGWRRVSRTGTSSTAALRSSWGDSPDQE